jgi:hypothetical protein
MDQLSDMGNRCYGMKRANIGDVPEASYPRVSDKCPVCGKHLKSSRSYAGHMFLAHGKRVGFVAQQDAKIAQLFDLAIALNGRLDRIEAALAYVAVGLPGGLNELDKMADFLNGSVALSSDIGKRLYRGKGTVKG